MKKIQILMIIIAIFCYNATIVLADNESSGAAHQTGGYTANCSGSSCKGIVTDSKATGVRITFVDENGKAVTSSFDFLNYYSGGPNKLKNFNIVKNTSGGNKSKMDGSFSRGTGKIKDIPNLSSLISEFNSYTETDASGKTVGVTKSSLRTTGNTGVGLAGGFGAEKNWFLGLTDSNNSNYRTDVNGLVHAISKIYPEFNAENFMMELGKGCTEGKNIFIQMEPMMLYWKSSTREEGFGTIRDLTQIWPNEWRNYASEKTYKLLNYPSELQKVDFKGYTQYTPGYKFTSDEQINDSVGYGAILDWANDSENYCGNQCVYNASEKNFYYNDEVVSTYNPPFSNMYEYILSSSEGGLNCCNSLAEAKDSLDGELKEYYDYYCDLTGDPCTEKKFESLGKTIYFCPDAKQCSYDDYMEQCNVPPPCDDDPTDDPDNPGDKCCTDDPIEPGKIEGEVHNCCTDGGTTSKAKEYPLNDLFCNNDFLGINNYQYKCGADFYTETEISLDTNDYCDMYCTERISVEIPEPITATSGRYFELTETSHETKSSYIDGYKRCRVRIQYDKWEKDYYDTVKEQEEAYNNFQHDKAYKLMYDEAIKAVQRNISETSNIKCKCSCTHKQTCTDKKGKSYDCSYSVPQYDSGSCEIKYDKYPFNKMFDIFYVEVDEEKRNACENIYDAIEFKEGDQDKTEHRPWSSWGQIESSIAQCEAKRTSMQVVKSAGCNDGGCTLSCSRDIKEAETVIEDVPTVRDEWENKAQADNTEFNAAADIAKDLEETINECDKYFTDYDGANAEENYQLNTTQKFSYTQIYMDNFGTLQLDEIFVEFEEDPACKTDAEVTTGVSDEDGMQEKQYSSNIYSANGDKIEEMTDFKNSTLEHQKNNTGFKQYNDTMYPADKIFTTDGRYHATCWWKEGPNTLYTLVPSGAASEEIEVENYTTHDYFHKVYLSTLEGTYETYWALNGLGTPRRNSTEGRFDQFFRENGKDTCSGATPTTDRTLACTFTSKHEIVLTGYCNDIATNPDDCDPYREGHRLFNFKVVDAANLFPSESSNLAENVGHNWLIDDIGKQKRQEIQAIAASGSTFAPENLTYSFILSPTDMGHIKDYNSEQSNYGGYSDFTLTCSKTSCEAGACDQCKSHFIEDLANGNVNVSGMNYPVTGWNNRNMDLTAVRRSYGWN